MRQRVVLGWIHQRGYFWARLAAEMITLQLNVTVGDAHGKEVQTVRTGSGGDIAGLGLGALPRAQISWVVKGGLNNPMGFMR